MKQTEKQKAQYADLKGRRFRPTFSSNIDFFEIRGYDAERDMVLTTAHPKGGSAFDDEIEERYLAGAFETGEYEASRAEKPLKKGGIIDAKGSAESMIKFIKKELGV